MLYAESRGAATDLASAKSSRFEDSYHRSMYSINLNTDRVGKNIPHAVMLLLFVCVFLCVFLYILSVLDSL